MTDCADLIAKIRNALKDEHEAVNKYTDILRTDAGLSGVDDKTLAKTISMIRDEELEHEKELIALIEAFQQSCKDTTPGLDNIGTQACIEYKRRPPYVD